MERLKNNRVLTILIFLLAMLTLFIWNKAEKASNLSEEKCLIENYENVFKGYEELKTGNIYDFSEIFDCKDWTKTIIVGEYSSRAHVFLKTGVLLPKIDFFNIYDDAVLIFFINNNNIISKPIIMWLPNFVFSSDLGDSGFLALDKKDAFFKYVELETLGFNHPIYSFELVKRN